MNPKDWISAFLTKRGLQKPSGKPIYSYKTTDEEYNDLIKALRVFGVYSNGWDACFVLYACEWWRRNYDGGHWSWDSILRGLKKNFLMPYDRQPIVKRGFKFWGRNIYRGHKSNRYLGTVIVESGIPQKILGDKHYISSIIKNIYNELGAISSMQEEYLSFIEREAQTARLPNSLQQDPFYTLIGDIVSTLADLQEEYDLSTQEKPLEYLDTVSRDWRDDFPIRIENAAAKSFIDNLLSEVAKTPPPRGFLAKIDYTLENIGEEWFCKSYLSLKEGLHRYDRFGLSEEDYKGLSSKLEFYCSNGEIEVRLGYIFKISGKASLKTDGIINQSLDQNALVGEKWSIFLSDPKTGKNFDLPLSDVDFSVDGEPLVFANHENSWRLTGSGSVRAKGEELRILANENTTVQGENCLEIGHVEPGKLILQITSICLITDRENEFRIIPNSDDDRIRYEFHPQDNTKVFPFFPRKNKQVFLGFPKVYQINTDTGRATRVLSGLEYYKNGNWFALRNEVYGRFRLRLRSAETTHFVKTIAVLPPDLSFRFKTDGLPSLRIITKSALSIRVKSEVPSQINQLREGQRDIIFSTTGLSNEEIPESCQVECLFDAGVKSGLLTIPFPRRNVVLYDKSGHQIAKDTQVYVDNLPGSRLSINNPSDEILRKRVIISLRARDVDQDVRISKVFDIYPLQYESLPMISFYHQFNRLFSLTSDLDAYLQFEIDDQRIRIAQFPDVKYEHENVGLLFQGVDDHTDLSVDAMRLDIPYSEDAIRSLGFESDKKAVLPPIEDGLWLIYPDLASKITFRPKTIEVFGEEKKIDEEQIEEMYQAALIPYEQRREKLLDIYRDMIQNLEHPDWERLSRLFLATSHLPLSTFNNWVFMVEVPEALILGVFMLQKELIERLTQEFSIVWHEYPVKFWISAYERYMEFANSTYGQSAGIIVETRIQIIEDLLGLQSHTFILKGESQPITEFMIKLLINENLNGKEGQAGLRARHQGDRWPDKFSSTFKSRAKRLPYFVKRLLPQGIPEPQKGIVYLPFILAAAANSLGEAVIHENDILNRFRMTEMIEFDEQWFDQIYGFALGYIWNQQQKND